MANSSFSRPPTNLREKLGDQGYKYLLEVHRAIFGTDKDTDGTLDSTNVIHVEKLKTLEADVTKVLQPVGDGKKVSFQTVPGNDSAYITAAADAVLANARVLTGGRGIEATDDGAGTTFTLTAEEAIRYAMLVS